MPQSPKRKLRECGWRHTQGPRFTFSSPRSRTSKKRKLGDRQAARGVRSLWAITVSGGRGTFPGSFRVSSLSVSGRLPDDGAGGDSSTGSEATEPVGFGSAGTLVN